MIDYEICDGDETICPMVALIGFLEKQTSEDKR